MGGLAKKSARAQIPSDMTEDFVREVALPSGWVDNKVCAIDDTWSGLRCVLRVENRPPAKAKAKTKTKSPSKAAAKGTAGGGAAGKKAGRR